MRLEPTPEGVTVTIERPNPAREGMLLTDTYEFTVEEAEKLVEGLPQVLVHCREMAATKREYELRNLRAQLGRLEAMG